MIVRWFIICAFAGVLSRPAVRDDEPDTDRLRTDVPNTSSHAAVDCTACHTPATDGAAVAGALWDRRPDDEKRYRLYGGRTGTPAASSLLCLSCHDGSVAVDTFGAEAIRTRDLLGARGVIGAHGDLGRDHPIGIRYPAHDRAFRSRAEVEADGYVRLPEGRVECVSCHDIHATSQIDKLLVKRNSRSALCLTCHRK